MKSYRIPQLASGYIEYDMIEKYTDLPSFPDARVHLLYIFLNMGNRLSLDHTELYAIVTSLVQIGIDTHETIDTEQGNQAEELMRSRQLKVLAGDYYSSQFYQLLSDRGQIEVITSLSKAICDLNMMKMKLYSSMQDMKLTSEQYLVQKVQLNMQLFLSFTPMLEESLRDIWKIFLYEITRCETLMHEMNHSPITKNSYQYWRMLELVTEEDKQVLQGIEHDTSDWESMVYKYKSTDHMMNLLRESIVRLQNNLQLLQGDDRFSEIGQVLEPFLVFVNSSGTVVREG